MDIAAPLLRHIHACNGAVLPGPRRRLAIGAHPVGWVLPHHAPPTPLPDRAAFSAWLGRLGQAGAWRPRDEAFDVRAEDTGAVLAHIDRGAIPLAGTRASGVHLNGLVRRPDGLHLWVARRAASKKLDPLKLDHLVAGGVPAGLTPRQTLAKEAAEEAGLPPALLRLARHAGTLAYALERPEGLRRDVIHCFDLELPASFTPTPMDGEVAEFSLWPLPAILERLASSDDFKFNVALVLVDLLLRQGLIDPHSAAGRPLAAALAPLRAAGAALPGFDPG